MLQRMEQHFIASDRKNTQGRIEFAYEFGDDWLRNK